MRDKRGHLRGGGGRRAVHEHVEGGFTCSCVAGYSGDGTACEADKTVTFEPPVNGTLFAESAGVSIRSGETTTHGTTVTFTAVPAEGWERADWSGDCAGEGGDSCAVAATLDVSVGVTFADVDECGTSADTCAAAEDGGRCTNTLGGFTCSCVAGYSGDGTACEADKTVTFEPPVNGTLFAESAGVSIRSGETTAHGTTVTFTANPAAGWQVSVWLGACADTEAPATSCEAAATLHVDAGVTFMDINECETNTDTCAEDGGRCTNTALLAGGFTCSRAARQRDAFRRKRGRFDCVWERVAWSGD